MQMSGEQTIAADRNTVWAGLNDPELLRQCIPGCESVTAAADNEYAVVMTAAVGPVKAKFKAKLTLSEVVPPSSYVMTFDGSGGAAGFGKGSAAVSLSDHESGGTLLNYTAEAQVGGKIAQVGARLIDGVARKLADEFFTRFKASVEQPSDNTEAQIAAQPGNPSEPGAVPSPGARASEPAGSIERSSRPPNAKLWTVAILAACAVGAFLIFGQ